MTQPNQIPGLKDPNRAAYLGTLYPPAGYWYAGKKITAIFMFFLEDLMYALIPFAGIGIVFLILYRLFCRWELRKIVTKGNEKKMAAVSGTR